LLHKLQHEHTKSGRGTSIWNTSGCRREWKPREKKKNKDKVDELAVKKVFVSCIGGRLLNIQNFEMIPDQQRMS
jgi:hypothetical protein